ncbi:HIT family protein, partial [Cellulomonas rhizosphaerae]
MTDAACTFCRVVDGTLESSVVHEDDDFLAFMDIQPVTRGHVLVIPKHHATVLGELDEDAGAALFRVAQRVAAALRRSGLPCDGVNMFLADGEAAFQEVPHVHLHVFPRTPGDGFRIDADWYVRPRDELDEAAAAVRSGWSTPAAGSSGAG